MTTATGGPDVSGPVLVGQRGVPAVGDPGRAARELAAGFPPLLPAVPDHVLAEYATADLEIRAASIRGLLHRHREQPRQDSFSVVHDRASDTTVVVVCDGVGSLDRSHEAAALVVDRLPVHFWAHRDWDVAVKHVNADLQDLLALVAAAADAGADPRSNGMATTLVAVAISPSEHGRVARIVRSDDSTVWHLAVDGRWSQVCAQQVDPDPALHSGSVRALPAVAPRLHHAEVSFGSGALFVMTDGVGVPLENSAEVRTTLAGWWAGAPNVFAFGQQVGFARKTHLDDRTAVGMWLIPPEPGAEACPA